jgi:hypothetical protein
VKAPTVKLSPYERAVNRLNDLPPALDKVFSAALEDLRKQRDEANARHKEALDLCERYIRHLHRAEAERDEAKRLAYLGEHHFPESSYKALYEDAARDLAVAKTERDEAQRLLGMAQTGRGQLEGWRDGLERERNEAQRALHKACAEHDLRCTTCGEHGHNGAGRNAGGSRSRAAARKGR